MSCNVLQGDDPPYLSVGTEVSAKYKGAFCEAKIRKVVRSVKCRVTYKQGLGTATVTDDQIKGTLRVGASVEARHNDKKDFVEATITKIQDCSQYTVVFDDGDITTLRRTALCLKSGRHFAESETLDQLPLTHPEHFGNPVIGGRRGRRSRQLHDDSSDDDDDDQRGSNDSGSGSGSKEGLETEPEIGKVVCVELGDKKKKDNWFPGLIVAPTAQDTVRIKIRDDFLVRSFKDGRYYTVPKKEVSDFTKDLKYQVENIALKTAVEKALLYLEKNELPPHWDRDVLFGNSVSSDNTGTDAELDSDSSDDEPTEEKDHFVAQLYKFMDDRGTPINNCPMIGNDDIDLYRLFRAVYKLGGYNRVTNQNQWKLITRRLNFSTQNNAATHNLVKQAYKKFLHSFEDFYRKLGCTMVNHPRGGMRKPRPGRSLIRDKDRNTPVPSQDRSIKIEKDDDEKEKKINSFEEEPKKEKREIKKEPGVKEEVQPKVKRKEDPADQSESGQDSDLNIDAEEESSCSEKSQKNVRITPSSSVAVKAKASAKAKDEVVKKKPAPEKKKPEPKKLDKKDEKIKEEESAKTRSKSKDDIVKNKSNSSYETRETRTPSREPEKKIPNKQRRLTDEELRKRGRKKREADGEKNKSSEERSVEYYPSSYKGPIEIGDHLKVYYGLCHESEVTYGAKVIDTEKDGSETVYLVHYTGWNTRYDEWIKSSRVAHNYTQAQGRVKRTKANQRSQTPTTNSTSASKSSKSSTAPNAGTGAASSARRRAQGDTPSSGGLSASSRDSRKDDRESTPSTRSMTPSPLISNSLRTKSPATSLSGRTTRGSRNADLHELSRRSRRTSGHNDAIAAGETDSDDSDMITSDASAGPETPQLHSRIRSRNAGVQERNRREARRRAESRMKIEETSDGEPEKDVEEPRRGRRIRKPVARMIDIKSEPESEDEQPKGRDFDLNQIRSELKGFDKAVKLETIEVLNVTSVPIPEEVVTDVHSIMIKQEKIDPDSQIEKRIISLPDKSREIVKTELQNISPIKREPKTDPSQSDSTDDIYEFKEPEPFEFEVRNKRDSGGSTSTSEKEKDSEKEKEVVKKRVHEDEAKSPKKRQKTTNTATSPSKAAKTDGVPVETPDSKPKAKKLVKKIDDTEEAEAENEESTSTTRESVKPSNVVSGGTTSKRKGAVANETSNDDSPKSTADDKDKTKKPLADDEKSPKKRQPKTFGTAAQVKGTEKMEANATDDSENKKKARKIVKPAAQTEDNKIIESNLDVAKSPSTYSAKTPTRKEAHSTKTASDIDHKSSPSDVKDRSKKPVEDDVAKNPKKRQKTAPGTPVMKSDGNTTDNTLDRRKPLQRRTPAKKAGDDSDSGSDDLTEPREHPKYFSHYSGPRAKAAAAAALANDSEGSQDRSTKTESQAVEPARVFPMTATPITNDGESIKSKSGDTTSTSDSKQMATSVDKKRPTEAVPASKSDPKQEKNLEASSTTLHSLSAPAPLSTRLPATASIEEKLSAAAVFRSKQRDTKADEETDMVARKAPEKVTKRPETPAAKKTKDDAKLKHESEKKKAIGDQSAGKRDPLQEMDVRKDPLLEVMKKKEEEVPKTKKETESKTALPTLASTVMKTYGNQKKDLSARLEDSWKKNASPSPSIEAVSEMSSSEPPKDYTHLRKETILSKIKSSIDRDSVDSTDSSDSERRLTIIDNEDFVDDKCNESSSDSRIKAATYSSHSKSQFTSVTNQGQSSTVAVQKDLVYQSGSAGAGTVVQMRGARMEEDGENLNSLLCEEEIPGSPTPCADSADTEHRSSTSQHLREKADAGSKAAVDFVASQLPLKVPPPKNPGDARFTGAAGASTGASTSHIPVNFGPGNPSQASNSQQNPHPSNRQPQQIQPQVQHAVAAVGQPQHQHQANAAVIQRRDSNDAAPVMDNTPPTTPDSSISNSSGSPRDENTGGSTPSSSNEDKQNRDSSEAENDIAGKGPTFSEDDGSSLAHAGSSADRSVKPTAKRNVADAEGISPKKRKKRKEDVQVSVSGKKSPRQSARNARHDTVSDSDDDTSESSSHRCINSLPSQAAHVIIGSAGNMSNNGSMPGVGSTNAELASFSTRPSVPTKFNFLSDLDPTLDGNQRVVILMQRMTELRKTYSNIKSDLATVERRRKKLKRRLKEAQKAAKAEMQQACS
ncbi:hypothetical protein QAD02_005608 [Eretmocerus hayati]|uniref:Uncharacterized protein n=1 Tax=Eretmocerus hayati TaxID=131215 RepID=A0ACC2NT68_9HYME|nr:hypothetical protein QAD02_005608 [Eretmocerus hayati]